MRRPVFDFGKTQAPEKSKLRQDFKDLDSAHKTAIKNTSKEKEKQKELSATFNETDSNFKIAQFERNRLKKGYHKKGSKEKDQGRELG